MLLARLPGAHRRFATERFARGERGAQISSIDLEIIDPTPASSSGWNDSSRRDNSASRAGCNDVGDHLAVARHAFACGDDISRGRAGPFRVRCVIVFLAVLVAIGARAGGANLRITARVTFWGASAMALTAGIGKLFGTVAG
jgi:hypothetical protein